MGRSLRAAGVIAAVYGYFLIFAQFAWIELMRAAGGSLQAEKLALGGMALAGVASGFLAARRGASSGNLRVAFIAAALAAGISPWISGLPASLGISVLTGASIGWMTVTLAPLLRKWCTLSWIGVGTGLGYAVCNFPAVFKATHPQQAWIGGSFAILGALLVPRESGGEPLPPKIPVRAGVLWVIAAFTMLVWLDSAAFFIIQHSADLKSATWGGGMLWRNAVIHLVVAVAAGLWLRKGLAPVLVAAWVVLAVAAFAVNSPGTRGMAGWWYPAGVSLYSTALVAWPGYFSAANDRRVGYRAAWLYAVAGWFGSANGIGMAQTLQRVPGAFIAIAGAVILGGLLLCSGRWRSALAVAAVLSIACLDRKPPEISPSAVERGHSVYLAEGCIHCHSRYVRPGSPDELLWGPSRENHDQPVLIGNRRQGPDLSQVGLRRSSAWLKLHFLNPRDFSPDSPMPSYAHLFTDSTRGEDLIAWLQPTDPSAPPERAEAISKWSPVPTDAAPDASALFDRHCAICHGSDRMGRGKLAGSLVKSPANLRQGPFVWSPPGPDLETRLARIVKFGISGTDMPGHETFDDAGVLALARYLQKLRTEP